MVATSKKRAAALEELATVNQNGEGFLTSKLKVILVERQFFKFLQASS